MLPETTGDQYILRLNHMRDVKIEMTQDIARGTREQLQALLDSEKVEPYTDIAKPPYSTLGTWGKVFRKGGPLEWYNPPYEDFGQGIVGPLLTRAEAMEQAAEDWDRSIARIPHVSDLPRLIEG